MKFHLIIALMLLQSSVSAQLLYRSYQNYYDYQQSISVDSLDKSSLKKFQRIDWMYQKRLHPTGQLKDYQKEMNDFIQSPNTLDTLFQPDWHQVGNGQFMSNYYGEAYGNGRVSFIKFHPQFLNTIYVGTPGGCVWISEDNGDSWESWANVPTCRGFSDMAFDTLTNSMYLLTGDYDGSNSPFHGIYKSTDEGQTWSWLEGPEIPFGKKLMIHPNVPNLLYLNAVDHLYISTDGGLNWIFDPNYEDIQDVEFHTSVDSILYAIIDERIQVSYDFGQSFEVTYDFEHLQSGREELVTVAKGDSCLIYFATSPIFSLDLGSGTIIQGIFKSVDGGYTFELIEGSNETPKAKQHFYNMILGVYPQSEDRTIAGWVELFWNDPDTDMWTNSYDVQYIHADHHAICFDPKNLDCVIIGNDGGLYRSCDFGNSWENITRDMNIGQIYHFNSSNQCDDLIIVGTQDNGSSIFYEDIWTRYGSSDGISCGFSAANNDTVYWTTQFGSISRLDSLTDVLESDEQDFIVSSVRPDQLDNYQGFRDILEISPLVPGLLYFKDGGELYRSENAGEEWELIESIDFRMEDIHLSLTQEDYIAYSNFEIISEPDLYEQNLKIGFSFDRGTTWTQRQINHPSLDSLPANNQPRPSAISFTHDNLSKIWVIANGLGYHKVLFSDDYGMTWSDYSQGLPNVELNDILVQPHTQDAVFLATDMGVYYRDQNLDQWHPYSNNLPITLCTELRISAVAEKLRLATFGAGLWEVDLPNTTAYPPYANMDCRPIQICQGDSLQLVHTSSFLIENTKWLIPEVFSGEGEEPWVHFPDVGSFDVRLIVENEFGKDTLWLMDHIEVVGASLSITETLQANGSYELSVPDSLLNIVWSTGETSSSINIIEPAWYSVTANNEFGCLLQDSIFIDVVNHTSEIEQSGGCQIFPNPTNAVANIRCEGMSQKNQLRIYDALGRLVAQADFIDEQRITLNDGVYFIKVLDKENMVIHQEKLIVAQ